MCPHQHILNMCAFRGPQLMDLQGVFYDLFKLHIIHRLYCVMQGVARSRQDDITEKDMTNIRKHVLIIAAT